MGSSGRRPTAYQPGKLRYQVDQRHRPAEQEALHLFAGELVEEVEFLALFDAFGCGLIVECAAEAGDRLTC